MCSALRSNPLLAVLLMWSQVFVAIMGPAGMVFCRDNDGSTHVEFLSESCCVSEPVAGTLDDETQIYSADGPWCSESDCTDSPVLADPASFSRVSFKLAARGQDSPAVVVAPAPRLAIASRIDLQQPRVGDPPDGLRPVRLGLRSTVLVL